MTASVHSMGTDVGEQPLPGEALLAPHHPKGLADQGHQTAGSKDDEEYDDQTEHGGVQLDEFAPNIGRKKLVDASSEHRTKDGAGAADDRGDDHLQRVLELEKV